MVNIIDAFIFYNEIDLLQYRLEYLYEIVDYFIIVESDYTFMGNLKISYYNTHKDLFKKYEEKIIHINIKDEFPYKAPLNIHTGTQWYNEIYQRNSIKKGIERLEQNNLINNEDYIIISDVDEIVDINRLIEIKELKKSYEVVKVIQDFYYYNLNTQYEKKWDLVKIINYKKYKELNLSVEELRNKLNVNEKIDYGGWHLSYFGTPLFIKNKIENFSHQELNNPTFTNVDFIEARVKNQDDLFGLHFFKKIPFNKNNYLLPNLLNFYDKYLLY